jgi:hypothetical protein
MAFVDGENLTMRAQQLPELRGLNLEAGPSCYLKDVFIWMPDERLDLLLRGPFSVGGEPTRAYYYTSVVGDEPKIVSVRERLRALGFDPQVFKKDSSSGRSKGVDITLTKDMLSHAFYNNYDAAILVAGDGDYVPLIQEVKRVGKNVFVSFFGEGAGLAKEVRLVADRFSDFTAQFVTRWKIHNEAQEGRT